MKNPELRGQSGYVLNANMFDGYDPQAGAIDPEIVLFEAVSLTGDENRNRNFYVPHRQLIRAWDPEHRLRA